jgi:hypothetical protein
MPVRLALHNPPNAAASQAGAVPEPPKTAARQAAAVPESPKAAARQAAALPETGNNIVASDGICESCDRAHFSSALDAIMHDLTLRRGDVVMARDGARVFGGARRLPYLAADFSDFRKSQLLDGKERSLIDSTLGLTSRAEILRAFLLRPRLHGPLNGRKAVLSEAEPAARTIR